jgi:O-antigen ligase
LLATKKLINSARELLESVFLFIFYFFGLLALFFTFSRTSWVAVVLGLLILLIIFLTKKDKWAVGRLAALIFFSLVLATTIFFSYQELFQTRVSASGRLEEVSISERKAQLVESEGILKDSWLFGIGIGNYTAALSAQDESGIKKAAWDYQPVHNAFVLLWTEGGVFVLFFFLAFLVVLVRKNNRREFFSWSLLAILVLLMLFDHWLLSLPFGVLFLFFTLGLI